MGERLSATIIVRVAVVSGLLISGAVVWLAFSLPALEAQLGVAGEAVHASLDGAEVPVVAIRSSAGEHDLIPLDLMEEPDMVATWDEWDRFFARQDRLAEVLGGDGLALQRADGGWAPSTRVARRPERLHWTFYSQLFAALAVWLAALVTFAYSDRGIGARMYLVSGIGIAIVIWPAVVYSTRPLAMDATLFVALSAIDHAGGFIYSAGVLGMFLVYPVVLVRRRAWLWVFTLVGFLCDQLQVLPKGYVDFYPLMTVYFLAFVVAAPWQWHRARREPVARAAFSWMLLCALVGMISFVFAIMFPMVLGLETQLSQGFALSAYATTYAGVSLGILRLRLFELDRWWFRVWSWLIGGALMVVGDLLLMSLFDLGSRESLFVTLAIVAWLYFPVRQWVWARITRSGTEVRHDATALVSARDPDELEARLEQELQRTFAPLRIESDEESIDEARIGEQATTLHVPKPRGGRFVCHYRNEGRDLFRARDLELVGGLVELSHSVDRALRAHLEGQEEERERIRRDLHDDMGASIIRIIHAAKDTEVASLAKRTMRDLRNVLMALSPEAATVTEVLDDLRVEIGATVPSGRMQWQVEGEASWRLSSRQRANLVRTLREATTNALRHGDGELSYRFVLAGDSLEVELENASDEPTGGQGLGLRNIAARMEELGGELTWKNEAGIFALALRLPRTGEA